jgi:hypothetical protein
MVTLITLDGNINGDTLTILIQKILMNIQELKNRKTRHKLLLFSGLPIKILFIEYSLILNFGMKEAQEFKIHSNYMYYQVKNLLKSRCFIIFLSIL